MLEEITDRMIEKKLEIPENKYFIHADINEIHQVLMNLGTNAIHAIEEKGIQKGDFIRLSIEKDSAENPDIPELAPEQYHHIVFEDSGMGIPEQLLEKIFDPLFTTKTGGTKKGQGLGLAMVSDIVTKRHRGQIRVSSIQGHGTRFDLYLLKAAGEMQPVETKVAIQGGSETILVVDDDEAVRESVRTALEDFGYSVLTANDGEKGLETFTQNHHKIDAVILDIVMPRMSGRELLGKMLKIDPDVKVIISSGHMRDEKDDTILKSAQNYLTKPFEIDELESTLRQVLDL